MAAPRPAPAYVALSNSMRASGEQSGEQNAHQLLRRPLRTEQKKKRKKKKKSFTVHATRAKELQDYVFGSFFFSDICLALLLRGRHLA